MVARWADREINIDICRNANYGDIEELSAYIRQDWKSAMESHCGLPEYYIVHEDFRVQYSMNSAISEQIKAIGQRIDQIGC